MTRHNLSIRSRSLALDLSFKIKFVIFECYRLKVSVWWTLTRQRNILQRSFSMLRNMKLFSVLKTMLTNFAERQYLLICYNIWDRHELWMNCVNEQRNRDHQTIHALHFIHVYEDNCCSVTGFYCFRCTFWPEYFKMIKRPILENCGTDVLYSSHWRDVQSACVVKDCVCAYVHVPWHLCSTFNKF